MVKDTSESLLKQKKSAIIKKPTRYFVLGSCCIQPHSVFILNVFPTTITYSAGVYKPVRNPMEISDTDIMYYAKFWQLFFGMGGMAPD